MSFIVSARKYRPLQFDEVIGQKHVTETLKMALKQEKLAHAFLFTGPRGVGKTTCARILAKVINCSEAEEERACGACASCKSFAENASFNIIELDAASNNSVEHMRTLIDQVRFQPQHGKFKVFIIDEVHMLSSAAFNAFLKTLEEPPPYAVFILATTEKHKIIPTILSRCQIFDFKRIKTREILSLLQAIAVKEDIQANEEALYFIAEKAEGAMRDALSIFDRIASSTMGKIEPSDVIEKLNILDHSWFFKVADALATGDAMASLLCFNQVFQNGFEGDHFMNGLAEHFRRLLLVGEIEARQLLEIGETLKNRYAAQSEVFHSSDLMTYLDIANQCDVDYPKAKNKRLHVEIALLKMAHFDKLKSGHIPPIKTEEKKTLTDSVKVDEEWTTLQENVPAPSIKKEENISQSGGLNTSIEGNNTRPVFDVLKDTPSLNSIDELIDEVKLSSSEETTPETDIDPKKIAKLYETYTAKHPSPSIKNALKRTKLNLVDNELNILVPSEVSREILIQETDLMLQIREELNAPDLNLNVEVNKAEFPESMLAKPKKYLTVKEKYDRMLEINPQLQEFMKDLGLNLDQDYS